jgi:molybdate transport system substrate-binding protein
MASKVFRSGLVIAWLALSGCTIFGQEIVPSDNAPASQTPAAAEPMELRVFAAASLTDAFTQIGQQFEASHPGVTVATNFGGSQALRTQLEQGAAADVFALANKKEMDAAVASGLVSSNAAQVFLKNELVVVLPAENPGAIQTLEDLARPRLKLVLAAEEVPVGNYARQSLQKLTATYGEAYQPAVLANVVSNEDNVKQVVAKVKLGEADAAIVYTSDATAAPELKTIAIPPDANVIAEYPIAVLKAAPSAALARTFVDFVLSPAGQSILKKWGFTPVAPAN